MMRRDVGMPEDCCLIQAQLTRVGDRVRFRQPSYDYTVESVETDRIGHIRHRHGDGLTTCGYHPGELLWIARRDSSAAISEGTP